jgi:rubrerythrin
MGTFNLEKYLANSKKVDLSEFDFSEATRYPLSAEEIHCLEYMMDIESSTITYLRAVLHTSVIDDPEVMAFLSCWAYEEYFHGHAIREFLRASGIDVHKERCAEVQRRSTFRERLEEIGISLLGRATTYFNAAYFTWGAIQELTTLEGYGLLAAKTQNPLLRGLLMRIIKDERRHFSFYYNKANANLNSRGARRLTTYLLKNFWTPVGSGVKQDPEVDWMIRFIFDDHAGKTAARRIDSTIARLPGLSWFNLLVRETA